MNGEPAVPCLLISVGGTPNPVAYAIDHHQPEKVIFFASRDSRAEIESKVRPLTTHRWADQEIITTPDHQDLVRCMEALSNELPRALENLKLTTAELTVDYTGGTKTMSAALVLATIHEPVRYSYVGGMVRAKEGLGVVLDGTEAVVLSPNPWDVLAVELRRRIARQFNNAHFTEAAATAEEAAQRVGERLRTFFLSLRDVSNAYGRWHNFEYAGAVSILQRAVPKLEQWVRAANATHLQSFVAAVGRDLERLSALVPAFQSLQGGKQVDLRAARGLIEDLAAHGDRTCRLAGRPDDGVARLYSALEKLAKGALAARGIDNGSAAPAQVPTALREEFVARNTDPTSGTLRFGLDASYRLLSALGDALGERYTARAAELRQLLDARNNSLLVHGWRPVASELFERMLALTLDFLGVDRGNLPALPAFPGA